MFDLSPSEFIAQQRHVIEQDRLREARLARRPETPPAPAPKTFGDFLAAQYVKPSTPSSL